MVELAEIFRRYEPQYHKKYAARMLTSHRQAMRAIEQCRTEDLGGHVYYCQQCDETQYSYHSCRNRHCPKCQNGNAQHWLEKQKEILLPVPYFLLTFTIPEGLRKVARSHQKRIYQLLFRTSAAAAQHLARDPRFVGGQLGMVGVLHTWGRNLSYHPHVHYLVPAVGLASDGQAELVARKNFLLPVKALSRIFQAKFRDALRKSKCFDNVPDDVWKQDWVVHCQPVGDGLSALKYLAPYIFRVAISNNRILKSAHGVTTFHYKDTDTGKNRLCTLEAEEFMRRFLQHVLPKGFVKVRYYGFFSPGRRRQLAALRQQLVGDRTETSVANEDFEAGEEDEDQLSSHAPDATLRCPICGKAMARQQIIQPRGHPPP